MPNFFSPHSAPARPPVSRRPAPPAGLQAPPALQNHRPVGLVQGPDVHGRAPRLARETEREGASDADLERGGPGAGPNEAVAGLDVKPPPTRGDDRRLAPVVRADERVNAGAERERGVTVALHVDE